jgi:hypothetical protein
VSTIEGGGGRSGLGRLLFDAACCNSEVVCLIAAQAALARANEDRRESCMYSKERGSAHLTTVHVEDTPIGTITVNRPDDGTATRRKTGTLLDQAHRRWGKVLLHRRTQSSMFGQ